MWMIKMLDLCASTRKQWEKTMTHPICYVFPVRNGRNGAEWIDGRWLRYQHRVYCGEVALLRWTPARELESTIACRLGRGDKGGGWRSPKTVTGWDNPQ
jgi:hypothetical protein